MATKFPDVDKSTEDTGSESPHLHTADVEQQQSTQTHDQSHLQEEMSGADVTPSDKRRGPKRCDVGTSYQPQQQQKTTSTLPLQRQNAYREKKPEINTSSDTPSEPEQGFMYDDEGWEQQKRKGRKDTRRHPPERRPLQERRSTSRVEPFNLASFFKRPKTSTPTGRRTGLDQVDTRTDDNTSGSDTEVDLAKLTFLPQDLRDFLAEVRQYEQTDEGFSKKLKKLNKTLKKTAKEQVQNFATKSALQTLAATAHNEDVFKEQIDALDILIESSKYHAIKAVEEIKKLRVTITKSKPVLTMPKLFPGQPVKPFLWQDYYVLRDMNGNKDEPSRHLRQNWQTLKCFGELNQFTENEYRNAFYNMLLPEMKDHYDDEGLASLPFKDILKRMSDHYICAKSLPAKREFADRCTRQAGEELRTAVRRYERLLNEIQYTMPPQNVPGWKFEKIKEFIHKNTFDSVKMALARKEADALRDNVHLTVDQYLEVANHEEGIITGYEKYKPNMTVQAPVFHAHTGHTNMDEPDNGNREQQDANPAITRKPQFHKKKPYSRNPEKREFTKEQTQQLLHQMNNNPQPNWTSAKPPQPNKPDSSMKEFNDIKKQMWREQKQQMKQMQQESMDSTQYSAPPAYNNPQPAPPQQTHYINHQQYPSGPPKQSRYPKNNSGYYNPPSGPPTQQPYYGRYQGGNHPNPQGYQPRYPPRYNPGAPPAYQPPYQPSYPPGYNPGYQSGNPQGPRNKKNRRYQEHMQQVPHGAYVLHPKAPAALVQGDNYQSFYQQRAQKNWNQNTYVANTQQPNMQHNQPMQDPSSNLNQMPMQHMQQQQPILYGPPMQMPMPMQGQPMVNPMDPNPYGPPMQAQMMTFGTTTQQVPQLHTPPTYAAVAAGTASANPGGHNPGPEPPVSGFYTLNVDLFRSPEAFLHQGCTPQSVAQTIIGAANYKLSNQQSQINMLTNSCVRLKGALMEHFPNESFGDVPHVYIPAQYHPSRPDALIIVAVVGMPPPRRIDWKGSLYLSVLNNTGKLNQQQHYRLTQRANPTFEVIQMSAYGTYVYLKNTDPSFIDIEGAMHLHKDNPELYVTPNEMPFRYVWRKERDQVFLKNRPDYYANIIPKGEVKLQMKTPSETPITGYQVPSIPPTTNLIQPDFTSPPPNSQTVMGQTAPRAFNPDQMVLKPNGSQSSPKIPPPVPPKRTQLTKAKAMVSQQQQTSSLIKSKQAAYNPSDPNEFATDDPPTKPPMWRDVFYEQSGKFNPRNKEYVVFKLDINRKLPPTRYIKSAAKHYQLVADRSKVLKYRRDHWQKKQEGFTKSNPSLHLQQMMYLEEEDKGHDESQLGQDTVDEVPDLLNNGRQDEDNTGSEAPRKRGPGRPKKPKPEKMQANTIMTSVPAFLQLGPHYKTPPLMNSSHPLFRHDRSMDKPK